MKKIIVLLLSLITSSCVVSYNPTQNSGNYKFSNDIASVRRLEHATVALVSPDPYVDDLYSPYCSGVFVSRNVIVTANHCVREEYYFNGIVVTEDPVDKMIRFSVRTFRNSDGSIVDFRWARVVVNSEDTDLAVLLVSRNQRTFVRDAVRISDRQNFVRLGEPVYLMGHPVGYTWSFTDGLVSSENAPNPSNDWLRDGTYLQTNINAYFGNSGGPLVDNNGKLVGITSWMAVDRFGPITHISMYSNHFRIREILHDAAGRLY